MACAIPQVSLSCRPARQSGAIRKLTASEPAGQPARSGDWPFWDQTISRLERRERAWYMLALPSRERLGLGPPSCRASAGG